MAEKSKTATSFFHKDDLHLHYARWGNGRHYLVALHGFGRTYEDFRRFTRPLEEVFTVLAVDIFFHGKSFTTRSNADRNPISEQDFGAFFSAFLDHAGAEKAWLLGYSLGGRLALVLAQTIPQRIGGLYLFAPDGLIVNRWYGLLSHYALGRSIFRFFKRRPGWFFRTLNVLLKMGIVSPRTADFVESQIKRPEDQERVYMVWCFLRKLEPDHLVLGEHIAQNDITIDLFFGLYDEIIKQSQAKKLLAHAPDTRVHVLRSGHFLLTAANAVFAANEGMFQLPEKDPVAGE